MKEPPKGHKPGCACVKCFPNHLRPQNQRRPLGICPKHGEQKIRRPGGTVHCRSCVRTKKNALEKRKATWLRYPSQEAEVYRRAAEVRLERKKR